jgi:hypothetical protein
MSSGLKISEAPKIKANSYQANNTSEQNLISKEKWVHIKF